MISSCGPRGGEVVADVEAVAVVVVVMDDTISATLLYIVARLPCTHFPNNFPHMWAPSGIASLIVISLFYCNYFF